VVDGPGRPGPAAAAREPGTGVQALEDLPQRQPLLGQPAVEHAHGLGLRLVDDELAASAVAARQVAIAVRGARPDELAGASLLQLAAPEPLAQQGALVLGDGTLDLEQQLVARVVGDGAAHERHGATGAAELLQEQGLIGVFAGQAVWAEHADDVDLAVAHRIAQGIQARSVEASAAVALVAEDVGITQLVPGGLNPGLQGGELAGDGLLAFLALGRDPGIDGGAHGASPVTAGASGAPARASDGLSRRRWR
jgi:hypothetical protein